MTHGFHEMAGLPRRHAGEAYGLVGAVIKVHTPVSFDSQYQLSRHPGSSSVSRTICLNYLLPLTSSLGFMDKISLPEQFAEAALQSMGSAYPQRDTQCCADEDVRPRVAELLEQGMRHCILSSNPMTFEH